MVNPIDSIRPHGMCSMVRPDGGKYSGIIIINLINLFLQENGLMVINMDKEQKLVPKELNTMDNLKTIK